MKRIFLSLLTLFVSANFLNAQAPQFAVVRPDGTTYICPTFDSAYNKAANGDNIYLPGGSFSLTNPISKTIHIYGAGSNQDSSAVTGITILDTIVIIAGADNGSIEGVLFTGLYQNTPSIHFNMSNSTSAISNYTISSCSITHGIKITTSSNGASCSLFTIRNNGIGSYNNGVSMLGTLVNSIVSNNQIYAGTQIGVANTFSNNS